MMSGDRRVLLFAMLFGCCTMLTFTGVLRAQDIEPAFSPWVMVESEPRSAEVYRGDSLLGRTPLRVSRALADSLTVYYPGRAVWGARSKELRCPMPGEREGVVFVRFEARLRLRSVPHGAAVFRGDTLLGHTPLDVPRDSSLLTLRAAGYSDVSLRADVVEDEAHIVTLHAEQSAPMLEEWKGDISAPGLRVAVPAGLALIAGVASVMFKQHADGLYEDYLRKPDGALLSEVKKYDIYAGISLAIVQVGLGYLVYLLFVEQ